MNYILKHWRGELPLAVSFWVNVFFINIGIRALESWVVGTSPMENPVFVSRFAIFYLLLTIAVVYPWQMVGLWRSAQKHIKETKRRFWSGVVKVLMVLGFIGTLGNLMGSWPMYKEFYYLGFGKDVYSDYRIDLIDDGLLIHLQGGLGFGVSKEVEKLIDKNPGIEGIVLDSVGGRVYEGRELSKIIKSNGLDTYTIKGCYSACGTAFISGKKRYLAMGANLAFHQYNSGTRNTDIYIDMSSEQKKDLMIYENSGISRDFIDRIFLAGKDDLWYPTIDEMMAAEVIHEIFSPSVIKPINYDRFSIVEIDNGLLSIPAFYALKKYENDTYNVILNDIVRKMEKGAGSLEIQQAVEGYVQVISSRSLPVTSDDAVIAFARASINTLSILEAQEPILCMKNLFPEQYGSLDITQYLSNEEMMPMIEAMSLVITESYESPDNTEIDIAAAEELLSRVVAVLGDDASYLAGHGLKNRDEYSKSCKTIIGFYELILESNKATAGNGLRYVFSP